MFGFTSKSVSSKKIASKVLAAAAGIVLSASATFAQVNPLDNPAPAPAPRQQQPQDDGRFVTKLAGEIEGTPVVVIMEVNGTQTRGFMMIGTLRCPLQGTMNNGVVEGTWTGNTGRVNNFTITIENRQLTLHTNGKDVALTPAGNQNNNPAPTPVPAPRPQPINPRPVNNDFNRPMPAPQPANDVGDARMVNGQFFNMPVPAGWRQFEQRGSAMVVSQDGKSAFGVTGSPTRVNTAAEAVKECFTSWNVRDFAIAGENKSPAEDGTENYEAVVTFTGADGVARTGFVKAALMKDPNGGPNFAYIVHAAAPTEKMESVKSLIQLAMQIKVVPQQQQQQPAFGQQQQPARNEGIQQY